MKTTVFYYYCIISVPICEFDFFSLTFPVSSPLPKMTKPSIILHFWLPWWIRFEGISRLERPPLSHPPNTVIRSHKNKFRRDLSACARHLPRIRLFVVSFISVQMRTCAQLQGCYGYPDNRGASSHTHTCNYTHARYDYLRVWWNALQNLHSIKEAHFSLRKHERLSRVQKLPRFISENMGPRVASRDMSWNWCLA